VICMRVFLQGSSEGCSVCLRVCVRSSCAVFSPLAASFARGCASFWRSASAVASDPGRVLLLRRRVLSTPPCFGRVVWLLVCCAAGYRLEWETPVGCMLAPEWFWVERRAQCVARHTPESSIVCCCGRCGCRLLWSRPGHTVLSEARQSLQ
jgi:hypothetical protein